jgi:hypothetical protein
LSENKSVLNWTFCQLLSEKPNCTKIYQKVVKIGSESYDDLK